MGTLDWMFWETQRDDEPRKVSATPATPVTATISTTMNNAAPRRMRLHRTYKPRQFTATVSKRFSFEAAHSLPHLPVGHKCRNVHGHSYVVEVFVEGPVDKRGFVVDYAEISAAVGPVIESLDHKNLNHVFPFYTTAENIADWLLSELRARGLPVTEIRLYETAKTCVSVR